MVGERGAVDRVRQCPPYARVGKRMVRRIAEVEEQLIEPHSVDPIDAHPRQARELVGRVGGDRVDDVDLFAAQSDVSAGLVGYEAHHYRLHEFWCAPILLVSY